MDPRTHEGGGPLPSFGQASAAATSADDVPAFGHQGSSTSFADILKGQLYADGIEGSGVSAIRVQVHRATNLVYKVVAWRQPRVRVSLGQTDQRSSIVTGTSSENPVFNWTAEFR